MSAAVGGSGDDRRINELLDRYREALRGYDNSYDNHMLIQRLASELILIAKGRSFPSEGPLADKLITVLNEVTSTKMKFGWCSSILRLLQGGTDTFNKIQETEACLARLDKPIILNKITRGEIIPSDIPTILRSDKKVMLAAIARDPEAFKFADAELKKESDFLNKAFFSQPSLFSLELVEGVYDRATNSDRRSILLTGLITAKPQVLAYMKDEEKTPDFMLYAIKCNPASFAYTPLRVRVHPEFIHEASFYSVEAQELLDAAHKDDKTYMMSLIQRSTDPARTFNLASARLKNDPEIIQSVVINAIQRARFNRSVHGTPFNSEMLSFIPEASLVRALNSSEVLNLLKEDASVLTMFPEALKGNPGFILRLIQERKLHISGIKYASETVKNNKEFALQLLALRGKMLTYLSLELKNDPEVVLQAIKNDPEAFLIASEELQNNPIIALNAVRGNGLLLQDLSEELKNDPVIVLAAIENNPEALVYASDFIKNDKTFALDILKTHGILLKYFSPSLKNDEEVVITAIKNDNLAYWQASEEMRLNVEVAKALLLTSPGDFFLLPEALRNQDSIAIALVEIGGPYYFTHYLSNEMQNRRAVALALVKKHPSGFESIPEAFKTDPEFRQAAFGGGSG